MSEKLSTPRLATSKKKAILYIGSAILMALSAACGSGYQNGELTIAPGKKLVIQDREGQKIDFTSGQVELSVKKPLFSDYRITLSSATQQATIQVDPDLIPNGTDNFTLDGKAIEQEFNLKGSTHVNTYSEPAQWSESCRYACGTREEYRCGTSCGPTCHTSCKPVCRQSCQRVCRGTDCRDVCREDCSQQSCRQVCTNQCRQSCGWERITLFCNGVEHHTGAITHTTQQYQVHFTDANRADENLAQILFPMEHSSSRQSYSSTGCR